MAAGGGMVSAAAAAGGFCSVTAGALMAGAATGLATALGAAGVGLVAYKVGEVIGEAATHAVMKYIFGKTPIPESGNNPICEGDEVYHKNKSATYWGILGGIVLGAALAIALPGVGVFMGAAICGAVTGLCAGVGNALSQYGEKKGKVLQGSPNVFFESKAVARVGDLIECSDHGGEQFVAEGARTVFANGRPIARIGHSTTCDGTVVGGRETVLETDETSADIRLPIKSSVPLWLEELATYTGLVMDIVDLAKGLKGLADARTAVGDPVDVARGALIQEWHVLSFERTLPLRLNRYYYSTQQQSGHLGQNWFDEWSQCLRIDDEQKEIIYFNEKGGAYHYPYQRKKVYAQNVYCKHLVLFSDNLNDIYLFNRKQQRKYLFSPLSSGDKSVRYLAEISDRFGNKITFNYDEGNLSEVRHSDGFSLVIENQDGLFKSISYKSKAYNQLLVRFEHNDKGQLEFCRSFQYGELHHRYNDAGYMSSWWDSDATHVDIYYDERGRVLGTKTESGHYEDSYRYDDENHCTYYIDAEGGESCYWYNKDYVVTKIRDALGHVTESEWDYGQKVAETDALGRETRYAYNDYGDISKVTTPDGRVYLYKYNGEGLLLEIKNSLGEYWEYRYGTHNELRFVIAPNKLKWEYRYNERYQVARQQLPDGNYWSYGYNEENQLTGVRNSKGEQTQYRRDMFDRITTLVRTDGSTYRYEYSEAHANPNGSLTKVTTPEGSTQQFGYNSERLLKEAIDGNGNKTKYGYGAYDLLESQTLPNGETLTFHYDKLTRLTEVRNSQGDSYRYAYDKVGQLISETDFTGRVRHYAYDPVGRLTRRTQADGSVETYAYDEDDKLLSRQTWQPKYQKGAVNTDEKTPKKPTALLDGIN
ncbi:PAAR domain-containing protein, partial [Aggregatibacter actinomycetemcomitans]|nr:PAAR domain-containing protein [Aggregatibacter actinomycetemcomitans]